MESESETLKQWFVLRDLKRPNAKELGYQQLLKAGFDVFTPLEPKIFMRGRKKVKEDKPVIHGMLFVNSTKEQLNPIINRTETLQYRFVKGGSYCAPLVVPASEMERFIKIVNQAVKVEYYRPEEITPAMIGAKVRIISENPFNCQIGELTYLKGSKKKLILQLNGLLAAKVEMSADFIELIESE